MPRESDKLASSLDSSSSKNDNDKFENMDSLFDLSGDEADVELFLERTGVGNVVVDVFTLSCDTVDCGIDDSGDYSKNKF